MTCDDNTCGTGGWTGPLPGDPDNNSVLAATSSFGGIDISFSYPTLNPAAVAHAVLYRSTQAIWETAIERAVLSGNFFFDPVNEDVRYYYWIQIVSVNATVGEPIGPVTALARPRIDTLIEEMAGKINNSLLAESLKEQLDGIALNGLRLQQEIADRISSNGALSTALDLVNGSIGQALVLLQDEVSARRSNEQAFVLTLNTVAAGLANAQAAIVTEQEVRAANDLALTQQVTTLVSQVDDNSAAIQVEMSARVTDDEALAESITALQTSVETELATLTGTVNTEIQARSDETEALGARIDTVQATLVTNTAELVTAQQTADEAAAAALAAAGLAAGKGKVLIQDAPPEVADQLPQNLWVDTTDGNNYPKRWTGTVWTRITDQTAVDAAGAAIAAQAAADAALLEAQAASAAVVTETDARVMADLALASQITTAQSTLEGNIATVETTLQTQITASDGVIDEIGALYTAKVGVNGLVGGFGIYNDGTEVAAGFDLDSFWIGRTGPDKIKPFIIEDGVVYLNMAVIGDATIDLAKIVQLLKSANFNGTITDGLIVDAGSVGWAIDSANGHAVINLLTARGNIEANHLNAATGSFAGELAAATGSFGGNLLAGVLDFSSLAGETSFYNSPGTYSITVPPEKTSMRVTLIGAGGAGGNPSAFYSGGGGGAGGVHSLTSTGLVSGTIYTLHIGAGGATGTQAAGGATYVSGLTSANNGGAGGSAGAGGAGGAGISSPGQAGGAPAGGDPGSSETHTAGYGASSAYGTGGTPGVNGSPRGGHASGYAAGGGGGSNSWFEGAAPNYYGGAGAPGRAIIEFFNPNSVVIRSEWNALINKLASHGITYP